MAIPILAPSPIPLDAILDLAVSEATVVLLFEAAKEGSEDGLDELVMVDVVGWLEIVENNVAVDIETKEEVVVPKLEIVVKGELEPESLKVPLPVWQSQELTGSDSQQNPLFPQNTTPASDTELNIPPGISAVQYCGHNSELQSWSVHEPRRKPPTTEAEGW